MQLFEDLKYGRPYVYRTLLVLLATSGAMACIASIPDTDLTRAVGLVDVKNRSAALARATYWHCLTMVDTHHRSPEVVEYGFLMGVDSQGQAIILLPTDHGFAERRYKLADTRIVDSAGASAFVGQFKQRNARIDLFSGTAVIWVGGEPINVRLVSLGFAIPESESQSNIAGRAFAAHFWSQAIRNKDEN